MSENQITDVERYLADVGRNMMDSAITEKDDTRSNELARVGDALTRLNTIYGPKADDFTADEWQLVEDYIAESGGK